MAANGFIPVGVEGRGWNGQSVSFWIAKNYATDIFYGDPVMAVDDGTIEVINSIADMDLGNMVGVFVGCQYEDSSGTPTWSQYYPASQDVDGIIAFVAGTDPLTRYRVRFSASGVDDDTQVRAAIGFNYDIDVTDSGSTITGNSGYGLETAGASSATENFRLVDLTNTDGGDSPSKASATTTYTHGIVIVEPLLHMYSNTTGI
jgi:hypothetical protein